MLEQEYDPRNVVVIYHGPCIDGFSAAWAAWLKFGDEARYYQTNYGKDRITGLKGKNVFILDFSYPKAILDQIAKEAESLVVLDHHITAQQELGNCPYAVFDMNRSGAGLAWDYFHGDRRPRLIDHVEDNDLWNHNLPKTREVIAVVSTTEKTWQNWTDLFMTMEDDNRYTQLIQTGSAVLKYRDQTIRQRFVHSPTYIYLDGEIVPAANSAIWQSEIGAALAKNNEAFAVVWYQMRDGRVKVSLRSDKNVGMDVEKIAKKYGGGGHKNSAGFITTDFPNVVNWEEIDGQVIT